MSILIALQPRTQAQLANGHAPGRKPDAERAATRAEAEQAIHFVYSNYIDIYIYMLGWEHRHQTAE